MQMQMQMQMPTNGPIYLDRPPPPPVPLLGGSPPSYRCLLLPSASGDHLIVVFVFFISSFVEWSQVLPVCWRRDKKLNITQPMGKELPPLSFAPSSASTLLAISCMPALASSPLWGFERFLLGWWFCHNGHTLTLLQFVRTKVVAGPPTLCLSSFELRKLISQAPLGW